MMNLLLSAPETAQASSMDPFVVMIVGMAVVFLGIVILIGVVKLVGAIVKALVGDKQPAEKKRVLNHRTERRTERRNTVQPSQLTDAQRSELIAAISCAIAENMGKPVSGIRIRSIRKVG
ncbi:MAG: OadG family protein [Clostridia bacterium]|nr:OadG family protein [Clostridia bacterium]